MSLRDLQFRRRRFVVGIAGTSVVLALTLILAGVSSSFVNEVRRTTEAFNAASWVIPDGSTGPFLSSETMPASVADELRAAGADAVPVALIRGSLPIEGDPTDVNLIGVPPGTFADPPVVEGRGPRRAGEIVVDDQLGLDVGEDVELNGRPVVVVGRTDGLSYAAGVPSAYVVLPLAQEIGYRSAPLASTVITSEPLTDVPEGFHFIDDEAVKDDLIEPVTQARQTIYMVAGLLWLVAAMIIGSIVYLSSLDRGRDFAVYKAIGATDRSLLTGIVLQALLLTGFAYAIGSGLSRVLAPLLPMQTEISGLTYVVLAGVAVVVAALASLAGVRRAVTADPALAFGGS
ncbi:MAG TPA: ABC transporter permease [Acidimicrobiales bacterium]|nr:ABC transporter permease [Acidimicrobiales bacterium]